MRPWNQLADEQTIEKTIAALKANGMEAEVVDNAAQAKQKALTLLPAGSEIMVMSSVTLDAIGLAEEINKPNGNYASVRTKLMTMDRKTQAQEMNSLGAAPAFTVGSVQAVTESGHVIIASNTGSQIPAYAYAALYVLWIVGAQKIVKDIDEGMKRIYDYCLPLESERAKIAYGVPGSSINKILIVDKEVNPGRITVILVKETLGY